MSNAEDKDLNADPALFLGSYRWAALSSAAIAALLACYWGPALVGNAAFFVSDHTYYFEPFAKFLGQAFREGRIPQWNPYLYCGMSQLAVPSPGIFYPANLLFAIMSYSQAVALQMLLHQVLAGFGTFLFVSSLGWGLVPAAVASLVMALTGYMFSLSANCTLAFTASFLPLALWVFRSIGLTTYAGKTNTRCWLTVLAGISVFMLISAGRPEVFAPSSALIVLYCLLEGLHKRKSGTPTSAVFAGWWWQFIAFVMGLSLAAPMILPVAEWAAISPRAKGFAPSTALMWSTNWYDFVGMICPQAFGNLFVLNNKYLPLVSSRATYYPFVPSMFVGPVCFSLAIWGFFDRNWPWRKWLLLALLFFIIACLGEFTPVVPYMVRKFRFLSVLRYPVKMMIFPITFLALAAARGAKELLANEVTKAARIFCFGFWILGLTIGITYLSMGLAHVIMPWQRALPDFAEVSLGISVNATAIIGIICCIAELFYSQGKLTKKVLTYLIIGGLSSNLAAVAFCNKQMTTRGDFFSREQTLNKWLAELEKPGERRGRFLNLAFDPLQLPADYQFDKGATMTSNFFAYGRDVFVTNTSMDAKRSNSFGYEAGETGTYRQMVLYAVRASMIDAKPDILEGVLKRDKRLIDLALLRLCQSTATQWVGSQIFKNGYDLRLLNPDYFELVRQDRSTNYRLYRAKAVTPRCYFSQYWQWIDNSKVNNIFRFAPLSLPQIERGSAKAVPPSMNGLAPEIPRAPAKPPQPPESLSEELTIDRLDRLIHPSEPENSPRFASRSPNGDVTIMLDEPEHVSISTANKQAGFLILCDHFYPGWCAYVDSLQVPMYKVNMEMRAVYLPAGTHLVQFEFQSESLRQGLTVAACGLSLLLCFFCCAIGPAVWRFIKSTAGQ